MQSTVTSSRHPAVSSRFLSFPLKYRRTRVSVRAHRRLSAVVLLLNIYSLAPVGQFPNCVRRISEFDRRFETLKVDIFGLDTNIVIMPPGSRGIISMVCRPVVPYYTVSLEYVDSLSMVRTRHYRLIVCRAHETLAVTFNIRPLFVICKITYVDTGDTWD